MRTPGGGIATASVLAAVLFCVSAGPAAAASSPAYSPPPPNTYHVNQDVRITMDDGVTLASDEYVPDAGCPCPVILIQTPYRKQNGIAEANPYLAAHGYAEIVVEVRGTGGSEGYWDSFGAREQKDSAALVQWSAHRSFSNGKVGLSGVSYSAINQFLTAEQPGTDAVKALFPIVPSADVYRDVTFAGGNTDAGFIPLWLGLVTSLGAVPASDAASNPQIALNAESEHLLDVAKFQAQAVGDSTFGAYESMLPGAAQTYPDQAYDTDFYRLRSPIYNIGRVHQPTFIVGGEYDLFQRGEPILYNALAMSTAQKKLIYGPWYHVTAGAYNLTKDDGSAPVTDDQGRVLPSTNNLQVAWFDHWIKGVNNGIDAFPTVEAYELGANRWVHGGSWPLGGTRYANWYLGAGTLGTQPPAARGGANLYWDPADGTCSRSTEQWTAGTAMQATGNNPLPCDRDNRLSEVPGLTFNSPVVIRPLTFDGPVSARLYVSSSRPDATIVATLSDVAPDGTSTSITAGSLVASERALTTTHCGAVVVNCTVYAGSQPAEPWHPYTRASQQPMEAGRVYEVNIEVFPTFAQVGPGHELRLTLTASDVPHESQSLSTAAGSAGGVLTFHWGPGYPSSVYLGQL